MGCALVSPMFIDETATHPENSSYMNCCLHSQKYSISSASSKQNLIKIRHDSAQILQEFAHSYETEREMTNLDPNEKIYRPNIKHYRIPCRKSKLYLVYPIDCPKSVDMITKQFHLNYSDRCPMNNYEKAVVTKVWEEVQTGDLGVYGLDMMLRVFERYPNLRHIWRFHTMNDGKNKSKIENFAQLKTHGRRIFRLISSVVKNFDDERLAVKILFNLGKAHRAYALRIEYFPPMIDAFFYSLYNNLPKTLYKKEYEIVMMRFMRWMVIEMLRGYNNT
ncbi:hypothetical protein SNEBB_009901 [Seison nebaliae]|nr:hypothetical protein SNEBB_009901 [Seison nebaliae]